MRLTESRFGLRIAFLVVSLSVYSQAQVSM